jgi:transcriptional regulator with XRE-family HTH domain
MRVYILAMEFRKFIAKRLKEARLAKGLTQERLAQLATTHEKAIAKYEGGAIIPTAETLKRIAEALEVSADYFLFDQAKMLGVPRIQDPALFERYFVLETLDPEERGAALTLLDALIAKQRLRELVAAPAQSSAPATKKPNHKAATA